MQCFCLWAPVSLLKVTLILFSPQKFFGLRNGAFFRKKSVIFLLRRILLWILMLDVLLQWVAVLPNCVLICRELFIYLTDVLFLLQEYRVGKSLAEQLYARNSCYWSSLLYVQIFHSDPSWLSLFYFPQRHHVLNAPIIITFEHFGKLHLAKVGGMLIFSAIEFSRASFEKV